MNNDIVCPSFWEHYFMVHLFINFWIFMKMKLNIITKTAKKYGHIYRSINIVWYTN